MRVVFVGKDRVIVKRLIVALVTFGVSRRIWLHRITKEVDGHEVLRLDHRLNGWMLASPLLALVAFFLFRGLGTSWALGIAAALWLPSTIATARSTRFAGRMVERGPHRLGPWWATYVATFVPILGPLFHMGWMQDRLNRFWLYAREHRESGVDVDVKLDDDPRFVAAMGRAFKDSHRAGSRFDERREQRKRAWRSRMARWDEIRRVRHRARSEGGSTPILPWLAPRAPKEHVLHVECGRCALKFDARRDPLATTPILCPKCGLLEVLPGHGDDPLHADSGVVAQAKVRCGKCREPFHVVRDLHAATPLRCPHCGATDELPAPTPKQSGRGRAR